MKQFFFGKILTLAGFTIILVVMSEAQESKVIFRIIRAVLIYMRDLARLDERVALEGETNAATTP